jgi:hypothetical protein
MRRVRADEWLWLGYFAILLLVFVLTGCDGCEDTCARYVQVDCHREWSRTNTQPRFCYDGPYSDRPCFDWRQVCVNVCVERKSPRLR